MGAIFSPFLAVAWLLSSRLALSHCESVLSSSVLREGDVDAALAGAGTGGGREPLRRRASLDRVLQGLAALEVRFLQVLVVHIFVRLTGPGAGPSDEPSLGLFGLFAMHRKSASYWYTYLVDV